MVSEIIEVRIKRLRTVNKTSVLEALEQYAESHGLSVSGAVLNLLSTHPELRTYRMTLVDKKS
jgi:hypothetical protein